MTGLAGGGFAVTWLQRNDGTFDNIRGQLFAADGSKIGGEFIANDALPGMKDEPDIISLSGGGFLIAWSQAGAEQTGDGNLSSGSRAQLFDASGNKVGSAFSLNTIIPGVQQNPDLAALPTGGFVAAWSDNGNPFTPDPHPENQGIWIQIFDANGAKVGAAVKASTLGPFGQDIPDIEVIPGTGFIVTWRDGNASAEGQPGQLRAQVFDFAGNKTGEEFTINPGLSGTQFPHDTIVLANGAVVVGWTNNPNTTFSNDDVRARIFFPVTYGTEGDDSFAGTANRDFYAGLGGNDEISGGAEDDYLDGGAGSDTIHGGDGNDLIDGGDGNDMLMGGDGADQIDGGDGDDFIDVGPGLDVADGGDGLDGISADLSAELGNTGLYWSLQNPFYSGPAGTGFTGFEWFGQLITGNGADIVITGSIDRDDSLVLGGGGDTANVYNGNDRVEGGDGSDFLFIDYSDATAPLDGVDVMFDPDGVGVSGRYSTADGQRSVDFTSMERFQITGTAFADIFSVLTHSATGLYGGGGDDQLTAAHGGDVLDGGSGADLMYGLRGDDSYYVDSAGDIVIEQAGEGRDVVYATCELGAELRARMSR